MKKTLTFLFCTLFASAAFGSENLPISIKVESFQQKVVVTKEGKKITKWTKVSKVVPKDIVKYVDTVTNNSNKAIENVKVTNPINKNLLLIAKSQKATTPIKVLYSIDGGKTFAPANKLYKIDKNGKKHLASVKDYNAIEFIINKIPAHSKASIEFKVKIK